MGSTLLRTTTLLQYISRSFSFLRHLSHSWLSKWHKWQRCWHQSSRKKGWRKKERKKDTPRNGENCTRLVCPTGQFYKSFIFWTNERYYQSSLGNTWAKSIVSTWNIYYLFNSDFYLSSGFLQQNKNYLYHSATNPMQHNPIVGSHSNFLLRIFVFSDPWIKNWKSEILKCTNFNRHGSSRIKITTRQDECG